METPRADLLNFYRNHLEQTLLPFWHKALDEENGGVFTCYSNDGTTLLSRNKYIWSQGRFVWLWSKMSDMCSRGLLDGDAKAYLAFAGKTVRLILDHAVLENGHCVYLLDEHGNPAEPVPGEGYDTSFYVDCFVILGLAQYAQTAGDPGVLQAAVRLWDSVVARIRSGRFRAEPYPVPDGFRSQSIPMILLNVTTVLADSAEAQAHERSGELRSAARGFMAEIMEQFCRSDNDRLVEMIPTRPGLEDTMFSRHSGPGHSMECMWFVMAEAEKAGRKDYIDRACKVMKRAFRVGWDQEHGGLFRMVDVDGGKPAGRKIGDRMEQLIEETWDTKLWWPHSEALYALQYGRLLTGDEELSDLYEQIHDYVFRTFPHPDPNVGEWIQIRDRAGSPLDKVVALPVKDPFHIMRNVLLVLELLNRVAA